MPDNASSISWQCIHILTCSIVKVPVVHAEECCTISLNDEDDCKAQGLAPSSIMSSVNILVTSSCASFFLWNPKRWLFYQPVIISYDVVADQISLPNFPICIGKDVNVVSDQLIKYPFVHVIDESTVFDETLWPWVLRHVYLFVAMVLRLHALGGGAPLNLWLLQNRTNTADFF